MVKVFKCRGKDFNKKLIKVSQYLLFVDCLKSGAPSSMVGDVFFNFTCTDCAEDGQEDVNRMKMQWFELFISTYP